MSSASRRSLTLEQLLAWNELQKRVFTRAAARRGLVSSYDDAESQANSSPLSSSLAREELLSWAHELTKDAIDLALESAEEKEQQRKGQEDELLSRDSEALTAAAAVTGARGEIAHEILIALTRLDERLVIAFGGGDIRLVRTSWLLSQPPGFRVQHRQELEALERSGVSPSPLLSSEEAKELLRRGQRGVGVLSHAWLSPGNPDPMGKRMEVLRGALEQRPYLEACFIDYASLYQHPPGGRRTPAEQASFSRAIDVMGDLYASAIGTTVLQITEIPVRPAEFDGALCLFDLAEGVDESSITAALEKFGPIRDCEIGGWPSAIVRFSTHEAALAAKRAAPLSICAEVGTLYNDRSYAGRKGEAGRDDDEGRGW